MKYKDSLKLLIIINKQGHLFNLINLKKQINKLRMFLRLLILKLLNRLKMVLPKYKNFQKDKLNYKFFFF